MPNTQVQTLRNGLQVSISEDHRSPALALFLWYPVGGRDELPGRTGISHWVEHMMFRGTPRYPSGRLDRMISGIGGRWNGFTDDDCTAFYQVLPRGNLQLALDIEADRMTNCAFHPEDVEQERTVILAERGGTENEPVFWLSEAVQRAAFTLHPYRWGIIGSREDIANISREDLLAHYSTRYTPRGAHLTLAGAVDGDRAMEDIIRQFGGIEPGPLVPGNIPVEPPQAGRRSLIVRRPGTTRYYQTAYHIPRADHVDRPALHVLEAILSGGSWPFGFAHHPMGRSSRFSRELVDTGIASDVGASSRYARDPHLFTIFAVPADATSSEGLEEAIAGIVDDLARRGPTEEDLGGAKTQLLAQFTFADDAPSRALAAGASAMVGAPDLPDSFPALISAVSEEDVARVAGEYLHCDNETAGWFLPAEESGRITSYPPMRPRPRRESPAAMFRPSEADPLPDEALTHRQVIDGKTTLLAHRRSGWEGFRLDMLVPAGSIRAPREPGLARLAAELLVGGTRSRDHRALARDLDASGIVLSAGLDFEYASVSLQCRRTDRGEALAILREILYEPIFPPDRVDNSINRLLSHLREAEDDTGYLARRALRRALYPEGHPYHHPPAGDRTTLRSLRPEDVMNFRDSFWHPGGAMIAIASDLDPGQVTAEIRETLGDWLEREGNLVPLHTPPPIQRRGQESPQIVEVKGKSQADLHLGGLAPARSEEGYDALRMAVLILGGVGLGGRLGDDLREVQGLAYDVSASLRCDGNTGVWSVAAGLDPDDVGRALDAIREHLRKLAAASPTDAEMEEVRGYMVGGSRLALETAGGLTATLLGMERHELGMNYLRDLPDTLAAISPEAVRVAFSRTLDDGGLHAVIAGPPGSDIGR